MNSTFDNSLPPMDAAAEHEALKDVSKDSFHGWNDEEVLECQTRLMGTLEDLTTNLEEESETETLTDLVPSAWISVLPTTNGADHPRVRGKQRRPSSNFQSNSTPSPKLPKIGQVTMPTHRESREWKPSSVLFKPFAAGWVREVIYKQNEDGSLRTDTLAKIVYHAPLTPGLKARTFKTIAELQTHLTYSDQTLSWNNFSFRQEPMGALPGQEIIRGENEEVEIFPKLENERTKATKRDSKVSQGGLKVKRFSKMNERNSLESQIPNHSDRRLSSHQSSLSLDPSFMDSEEGNSVPASSSPNIIGKNLPNVSVTPVVPREVGRKRRSGAQPWQGHSAVGSDFLSAQLTQHDLTSGTDESLQHSLQAWPRFSEPVTAAKAILRPGHNNIVSCSIHCPGVTAFPSLSCTSCQSLFHPECVGLIQGIDYSQQFDFYCISCQPPAGKENSKPFSHMPTMTGLTSSKKQLLSKGKASSRRGSQDGSGRRKGSNQQRFQHLLQNKQHNLPRSLSITPTSKSRLHNQNSKMLNGMTAKTRTPKHQPQGKARVIESQTVVNIGGIKYLIVPHPVERPKSSTKASSTVPTKLPILLQPSKDSPNGMPTFEVEETADGKLLLVPANGADSDNPFKKQRANSEQDATVEKKVIDRYPAASGVSSDDFSSNLSASYFAMLHIFKYLNVQERLRVCRVCKLWRDLAMNPCLWTTLSLKNIRVTDWSGLGDFLVRCRTRRLDMRKMLYAKAPEETWLEIADVLTKVTSLTDLQFPRASISSVLHVANSCASLKVLLANNLPPKDTDLGAVSRLRGLEELSLKASSGRMRMTSSLKPLEFIASSLVHLSLLGLEKLEPCDLEAISSLGNLQHLELGDCSSAPPNLFQSLTALTNLCSVRIERGLVGINVGELRWLGHLQKLELIDVQLKEGFGDGLSKLQTLERLLLIPCYLDEVASVNTEIVDSAMAMGNLTHFYLGLTNEWLESMNSLLTSGAKDSFPILVNGVCEMYSLSKLFKTLSSSMPQCRVKILKMSRNATGKQFLDSLIK